ncbi:MAG: hypothetical protein AB7N76_04215 [Planctomycetota bacterium]
MTQRLLWIVCLVGVLAGFGAARAGDSKCEVCAAEQQVCAQINDQLPRCEGCKEAKVPCAKCALAKAKTCGCKDGSCEGCKNKQAGCLLCSIKQRVVASAFCCGDCEQASRADSCAKCQDLRKKLTAAAGKVGCAACGGGKTESKDGVSAAVASQGRRVTVDRGAVIVVSGYYTFQVAVKNENDANKTLKGKVTLLDAEGKEVGSGTLFQKLGAKETVVKTYNWKASSPPADFKVEVEKIFNF